MSVSKLEQDPTPFASAPMPVFRAASLEIVCGQCGFELVLPADSTAQIHRCPCCWMHWDVDLSDAEVRTDPGDSKLSPEAKPVVEFRSAVDEAPLRLVKHQPLILPQPEDDEAETRNFRKAVKEWFAGYGVSLAVHALLLFLGTLFVYHNEILHWGTAVELSLDDGLGALGEMGGIESLELPTFKNEPPESADAASKIVFSSDLGGSGISQGTARGAGDGSIGFFGTHARGRSFAFVVDCSGSMAALFDFEPVKDGDEPIPRSRLQRAKVELLEALRGMKDDQSFSLAFYDHGTYWMSDQPDDPQMIPATRENKQLAIDWIERQFTRGGTDPRDALKRSLSLQPDVVFLLTDGQIPPETREVVAEHNVGGTVIHTTCIGALENPLLQLISEDHRGVFRPVSAEAGDQHLGIALIAVTSSKPAEILKYSVIRKKQDRLLAKSAEGKQTFAHKGAAKVLYLHNAISTVPEFNLELQKLIRALNSGTVSGLKTTFRPALLGYGVPLTEKHRDFLSEQEIQDRRSETMTVRKFLSETVGSGVVGTLPVKIHTVSLEGDLDSNNEISNGLTIYNLYHESELSIDVANDH